MLILHRKKQMSFNLFDKNCTEENVQLHLQHGESWLGGIQARIQRLKEVSQTI